MNTRSLLTICTLGAVVALTALAPEAQAEDKRGTVGLGVSLNTLTLSPPPGGLGNI